MIETILGQHLRTVFNNKGAWKDRKPREFQNIFATENIDA
jgi:hypothetical protein